MGEGARRAEVMLVGEQPGDREDVEGHPFVGPAGRVLDQGLARAGVGRDRGRPMGSDVAELVAITTHPSAILRSQDDAEREAAMEQFVDDLKYVARWLHERRAGHR